MAHAIDTRNFTTNSATAARINQLSQAASVVSAQLPGTQAISVPAFNSLTGTPNRVLSDNAPSTAGALIEKALSFVTQTSSVLGFAPGEPVEFVPDSTVETTSSDSKTVHLQQSYLGIPVFQMVRTVRFSPDNAISDVVGNNVNLPPEINIAPQISVIQAVLAAAQYVTNPETETKTDGWGQPMTSVRIDLSDYVPRILVTFPLPSKPTVLDHGPFADLISASLVLFYQNPETRLGWYMHITLPNYQDRYEVIISADRTEPEILYCQSLMRTVLVDGNIYQENPVTTPRQLIPFPRNVNDYHVAKPNDLPLEFPGDWCTSNQSVGNNTIAALWEEQRPGQGHELQKLQGRPGQSGKTVFDPADPIGDEQKILNIFYFCNYMHDFFYLLGFNEKVGNFQEINFTGVPIAGDPVDARAFQSAVQGTANMFTRGDGIKPIMNMGTVNISPTETRHTAFDSDVVFHEFTHGVTNRLVGGRMNSPHGLQQIQSGSMGEGWSDYFALTIQNFHKSVEKVVTGDWVVNNPNGIRGLKYDSSFPDRFGKIGTGRYNQVHNIGEIWCATLMEMNREIGTALGSKDRGHQLGWQIVVDALKLSPSNPSFLDERDAILKALNDLQTAGSLNAADYTKVKKAVWTTFAKFGMGPNADCFGATLSGIVEDTNVPSGL